MDLFLTANFWVALLTLTSLELVLGVDNLIFIAVVTSQLPKGQQKSARRVGLALACLMRLLLLAVLTWIMQLKKPLFALLGQPFSARDLILIIGGLFLLVKATQEIRNNIEGIEEKLLSRNPHAYLYLSVILQIMFLDMVFSLDSVITAIGLTQEFLIMVLAICITVAIMIFASEPLSRFVNKYPTLKILGLSFLLLIGAILITDGFGYYIPRGYLYFAIIFSMLVESINIMRRKRKRNRKKLPDIKS